MNANLATNTTKVLPTTDNCHAGDICKCVGVHVGVESLTPT